MKAHAGDQKVYVFIDDLDRCEIPKAADMMQAINLMISHELRLIFIIGMDREKVAASIAVKHEKLLPYLFSLKDSKSNSDSISKADKDSSDIPDEGSKRSDELFYGLEYGYQFIEKFIQLPFQVPQPTASDIDTFVSSFSEPKKVKQTAPSRSELREKFSRIFQEKTSEKKETDTGRMYEEHGGKTEEYGKGEGKRHEYIRNIYIRLGYDSESIIRIIKMVAPALDNNPRRIKQFVNLFRSRVLIAGETGLLDGSDAMTLEQLGKLVAISLKWPTFLIYLDADRSLLAVMQKEALEPGSTGRNPWSSDKKFIDLLRIGCDEKYPPFDAEKECNLSTVNVDRLLQVSPQLTSLKPSNFIGIKFTRIREGDFMMGSVESDDEQPVHRATINKPYYLRNCA